MKSTPMKGNTVKKKALLAAITAVALAGILAACSTGGGTAKSTGTSPKLTGCSNKYVTRRLRRFRFGVGIRT